MSTSSLTTANDYTLELKEVSADQAGGFDSTVFLVQADKDAQKKMADAPVFVPAAQVKEKEERLEREVAEAHAAAAAEKKTAEIAQEKYQSTYPSNLNFDYSWDRSKARALGVRQIWDDGKFTYIQGKFEEPPVVYEPEGQEGLSHQLRFRKWPLHRSEAPPERLRCHRQIQGRVPPPGGQLMGTVPVVPSAKPPIGKTMPIVLVLTGAVVLIGASTAYNAVTGSHKKGSCQERVAVPPGHRRYPAGERVRETAGVDSEERCAERPTSASDCSPPSSGAANARAGAGDSAT